MKGFEVGIWHAVYAPKKTPKPVLDTLVSTMQAGLKEPDFIANLAKLGTEPVPQNQATPAYLEKFLKAEIEKWAPVIKAAGQYAD
jgi:tripartite-type tricarboxylate transporter receptor subunit TctC